MGTWITADDLMPFAPDTDRELLAGLIEDAEAIALTLVPALATAVSDDARAPAIRAILRTAIVRRAKDATGAVVQRSDTAGPFTHSETVDTRGKQPSLMFWPTEVAALRSICTGTISKAAYAVNLAVAHDTDPMASRPDLHFQMR